MANKKFFSRHYYWIVPLITLVVYISFGDAVFAQGASQTLANPIPSGPQTESLSDALFNGLGVLLNILYIITLPVLIIAGKAMDNSMIYGEFMNLDKPLYMLWNLSRTFANFAIGGVLLWKIFNYIFKDWGGNAPAILKTIIIKGISIIVGINISRFAIGALLDLSTIATYSLGSMPLGAIKEVNKNNDMPLLSVVSYFDYQSKASASNAGLSKIIDPYIYYKRGTINIPQCEKLYHGIVIGPKNYPIIPNKSEVSFQGGWENKNGEKQYCVINSQTLADITRLEQWKDDNFQLPLYGSGRKDNVARNDIMKQVVEKMESSLNCSANMTGLSHNGNTGEIIGAKINELGSILQFGDGNKTSYTFCGGNGATNPITISQNAYNNTGRIQAFLGKGDQGSAPYNTQESQKFSNLMTQSQGMVGPFVTLYMSLLNFSNLSNIDTTNASINNQVGGFIEFGLKAAISVATFIPLIALAATLIIRVVLLRGIIAFIPLGIAFYGLKDELPKGVGGNMKTPSWLGGKEIDAKSIIGLIFAPVLPVFILSISIIILQTLQFELSKSINSDNEAWQFFGITSQQNQQDPSTTCINFWNMQEMCYKSDKETDVGSGFANLIPWLFINIFGIGLMWSMMKVALSSSSITASIGEKVMKMGQDALGMVKIPGLSIGGEGIGIGALSKTPQILERSLGEKLRTGENQDYERLQKLFNIDTGKNTGGDNTTTSSSSKINITKNKENIQKTFLASTTASATAKTNNVDSYITNFSESLKNQDKNAYEAFQTLPQNDKATEILNYINSLDEATKNKFDKKPLENYKSLGDQLEKLFKETKDEEKIKQKTLIKKYITDNKLGKDEILNLFNTKADYKEIIEEIFKMR